MQSDPSAVCDATVWLKPVQALQRYAADLRSPLEPQPTAGPVVDAALPRQGFRIGELALMIRYEDGSELADLPALYPLPNAPAWLLGMSNLHGTLVPVFDLAIYLDMEPAPSAQPMLLVLGHGEQAAGIVINGLPQRLRLLPQDRIPQPPVPEPLRGCVNDAYWALERPWLDLQVASLLADLEHRLAASTQSWPST